MDTTIRDAHLLISRIEARLDAEHIKAYHYQMAYKAALTEHSEARVEGNELRETIAEQCMNGIRAMTAIVDDEHFIQDAHCHFGGTPQIRSHHYIMAVKVALTDYFTATLVKDAQKEQDAKQCIRYLEAILLQ